MSSNAGTWVLFHHDSSAAPQTVQTASRAAPRTLFQCVCTRRRNCIGQLSPFSEYAPETARFPGRRSARRQARGPGYSLSDAGALQEELKDFQRKVSDAGRATHNALEQLLCLRKLLDIVCGCRIADGR